MYRIPKANSYIYIYILVVALISFTLISSLALSSHSVSANSAGASVVVPAGYCNVTTGSNDVEHTATINNGIYQENIGTTTFKVVCGDSGGYSIYAIGYSGNEYGNTKLLATVQGSLNPSYDIITGIGTNEATTGGVSNWSMKLIPIPSTFTPTIESADNIDSNGTTLSTNASFANYHTIPTTYTKVATFPSVTDEYQGSSFQSTYAAYISSTQPAGTYEGKVKYTMVHPEGAVPNQPVPTVASRIGYVPNANGMIVDNMADQEYTGYTSTIDNFTTPLTPGGEATLWASNYKRPGYGFVGWSDTYDYIANTGSPTNPNAKIYGPNETIIVPNNINTEGLTLYAVWVKSQGTLQNWTCPSNTVMPVGTVTALTDTRDNNTYAVAKLADGKCWMIENLRLGGDRAMTLTAQDTDITSNFTLAASQNPSIEPWCGVANAACTDQSIVNSNNIINTVLNTTTPDADIYTYGSLYNWYSATAGTGTFSVSDSSTNATNSICPKGWRLPNGNGNYPNIVSNEFMQLSLSVVGYAPNKILTAGNYQTPQYDFEGSRMIVGYPNNFVFHGAIAEAPTIAGRGMYANLWSSNTSRADSANAMVLSNTALIPVGRNYKFYEMAVRCISK